MGLSLAGIITATTAEDVVPPGEAVEYHPAYITGVAVLSVGYAGAAAGPIMLSVDSLNAARHLRSNAPQHSMTAAWVAVGGCGAGMLGGGLMTDFTGFGFSLVAVGGGTALTAGIIQHKQNKRLAENLGLTQRASDRPVQLTLVPRANGLALAGTF